MLNLHTPSLKPLACLGAAALLALPLAASAQNVYRCPGPDGRHIFTDKPCAGQRLRISNKGMGTNVRHEPVLRGSARAPSTNASAASAPAAAPASAASDAAPAVPANPTAQGVQL